MPTPAETPPIEQPKTLPYAVKEFVTSIVIAFAMAFVFRGFVIEGFEIPTGSMAPTLLGKHALIHNDDSGYTWTHGPRTAAPGPQIQIDQLEDPLTRTAMSGGAYKTRWGDRLFVLKYHRGIYEPKRWDVVVFKAPHVHQNYIKRLVGLPGEQIAFADGDVFYRPGPDSRTDAAGIEAWQDSDWQVARKSERVQRVMWQPVFDSSYTPEEAVTYRSPWVTSGSGWTGVRDARTYTFDRAGSTELVWNHSQRPITDFTAYNAGGIPRQPSFQFPVSDIAMSLGYEPTEGAGAAEVTARLYARGHEFRAIVSASEARVEMRAESPAGIDGAESDWTTLDDADGSFIRPTGITEIEFWHVDQALWLFVDGELVAGGPETGAYDSNPAERIEMVTGSDFTEFMSTTREQGKDNSILADTSYYKRPELRWQFEGAAFNLHRVRVDRDIHYQITGPTMSGGGQFATRGAHPDDPALLSDDHFFLCGDNSPNSLDARAWDQEYPWVTSEIHDGEAHPGLTHRHLVVGRAFVVYLPSPRFGIPPVANTGNMRWVW
ncbi:MAG: signal peptidase I [Planctomycetota bacterium]